MQIQQSEATAARRRIFFQLVDATDGITAETGVTGTGFLSKNGATPVATSGSLVELSATNMPGRYYIEATAAEVDTLGMFILRFKSAATAELVAEAQIVPFDPYDAVRMGLTALPNAAAEGAGGLYTRGTGAGQINQPANGQADANVVAMAAAVLTATAIATDALTAVKAATDFINKIRDAIISDATTFAGANINATISSRATPAQVNTEVVDVLKTDTITLPGAVAPPSTPTFEQALAHVFKGYRNKKTQTATQWSLFDDAGTAIEQKATVSDDGTTATVEEIGAGP